MIFSVSSLERKFRPHPSHHDGRRGEQFRDVESARVVGTRKFPTSEQPLFESSEFTRATAISNCFALNDFSSKSGTCHASEGGCRRFATISKQPKVHIITAGVVFFAHNTKSWQYHLDHNCWKYFPSTFQTSMPTIFALRSMRFKIPATTFPGPSS